MVAFQSYSPLNQDITYNVKEITSIKKDQCSEICDMSDEETFYTIDMESGY